MFGKRRRDALLRAHVTSERISSASVNQQACHNIVAIQVPNHTTLGLVQSANETLGDRVCPGILSPLARRVSTTRTLRLARYLQTHNKLSIRVAFVCTLRE